MTAERPLGVGSSRWSRPASSGSEVFGGVLDRPGLAGAVGGGTIGGAGGAEHVALRGSARRPWCGPSPARRWGATGRPGDRSARRRGGDLAEWRSRGRRRSRRCAITTRFERPRNISSGDVHGCTGRATGAPGCSGPAAIVGSTRAVRDVGVLNGSRHLGPASPKSGHGRSGPRRPSSGARPRRLGSRLR